MLSSYNIHLAGEDVQYQLRTSRRHKHIRLTIQPGGNLIVSVPARLSRRYVETILQDKTPWITAHLPAAKLRPAPVKPSVNRQHYIEHKSTALAFAIMKVNYWNQFFQFHFQNIQVRNPKTRWGSCSRRGNLSFHYKIFELPEALADYLVVHELCHLQEFNHSDKFWGLVAQVLPNYQTLRQQLKQISPT